MKRKSLAALMVCVALAATGCGSATSEKETTEAKTEAAAETEAASETETEAASETETEAASETETEAASETESEAASETETEAASETETEAASETETEAASETETEAASETETEAASETETEAASETETEAASETETEAASETESEAASETETEAASETETEAASETESETGTEAESETASETETEAESETETEISVKDLPAYTASDYVTLGEYKGITVDVTPVAVEEAQVMNRIAGEVQDMLTAADGDTVNIGYVGKIDGEEFEGGSSSSSNLQIGSCTYIDGFEDGLIGMKVGETKDLELTFPEDYHDEDKAGKDCVFTVTMNAIQPADLELTDEMAAQAREGMTADEYKEAVKSELEESAKESQKMEAQNKLVQAIVADSAFEGYPEESLKFTEARAKEYYAYQLYINYQVTIADYCEVMGIDEETFEAETIQPAAESALSQEMVLKAVAEAEDITLTDQEYEDGLAKYAEEQQTDAETLLDQYGEEYIRSSLIQEKVLEFLYENADIVETEETESEAVTEETSETEEVTEAVSETETETASETETETEVASETETETASETETE